MNKLVRVGHNFTEGVKTAVGSRDLIAGAVMGSALRGVITRSSNEAVKGMYISVAVNSIVYGVLNVVTDGLLTEEDYEGA